MKFFSKALIIMLFSFGLAFASQSANAYTTSGYNGQNGTQHFQNGDIKKKIKRFRRWCRANGLNPRQCIRALRDRQQGQGVPELNVTGAPLGILLIGGLMALGFETRRRKQLVLAQ